MPAETRIRAVSGRAPAWLADLDPGETGLILLGFTALRVIAGVHAPSVWPDTASYHQLNFLGDDQRFWTIPLLYTIFGGDSARVGLQISLGVACWAWLALSVRSALRNPGCARAAFVTVLALGLVPQVTGWDNAMLSESISTSLLVAVIAAALGVAGAATPRRLAVLLAAVVLFEFTRQTSAIIALVLTPAGLWFCARRLRGLSRLIVAGVVVLVSAWSIVSLTAHGSEPIWQVNAQELTLNRIAADPGALNYFQQHGLPIGPAVRALVGHNQPAPASDTAFTAWIRTRFRSTYATYLLAPPWSTLTSPLGAAPTLASSDVDYSVSYSATLTNPPSVLPSELGSILWGNAPGDLEFWLVGAGILLILNRTRQRGAERGDHRLTVAGFAMAFAVIGSIVIYTFSAEELQRLFIPVGVASRVALILVLAVGVDRWLTDRRGVSALPSNHEPRG